MLADDLQFKHRLDLENIGGWDKVRLFSNPESIVSGRSSKNTTRFLAVVAKGLDHRIFSELDSML